MTKLVAVSDLHGYLPEIPEADILVVAGDVTPVWNHDRPYQTEWLLTKFNDWLLNAPVDEIVGVGGNHDFVLDTGTGTELGKSLPWHYLDNSSAVVKGLKFWGSPLSPKFGGWANMRHDSALAEVWEQIPTDTDVLVVHGPPFGYGDLVPGAIYGGRDRRVGSASLRNRLEYGGYENLKVMIFGHIHEGFGEYQMNGTRLYGVSHVDERYDPIRDPVVIEV